MMKSTHPTDTTYIGDDWVLPRVLGQPYTPLTGKTFQWAMASRGTLEQIIPPADATIIVTDAAAGVLEIRVAAAVTNLLVNDRYEDALRVVNSDGTLSTIQTGQVHVLNPAFNATAPAPPEIVGPPGPPGPEGPMGPAGPEGPPGPSSNTFPYRFNTSTTVGAGNGQVRLNNADQTLATKMWVSDMTDAGVDIHNYFTLSTVAAVLFFQDKDDASKLQVYTQTAPANHDPSGYSEFNVAWDNRSLAQITGGNTTIIFGLRE